MWIGCVAAPPSVPTGAPANYRYRNWTDAVQLTNGTVELIVVPSLGGRILRYGYVGEENVLWENEEDGLDDAAPPTTQNQWQNHGGEKTWPWPQERWKAVGREWPPPAVFDQHPYALDRLGPLAIRLTSAVALEFGFRIVREIRLAEQGTQATVQSWLVHEIGSTDTGMVPWQVCQMPVPDLLLARVSAEAENPGLLPVHAQRWMTPLRQLGDIVVIENVDKSSGKLGIDADVLAWVKDSMLLIQRSRRPAAGVFDPGERAQIFSAATARRNQYVELEFTAARTPAQRLHVTWELQKLPPGESSAQAVAARLRKL